MGYLIAVVITFLVFVTSVTKIKKETTDERKGLFQHNV